MKLCIIIIQSLVNFQNCAWQFDNTDLKGCHVKILTFFICLHRFNTLMPSDTIWRHNFESTLGQQISCCLTALIHYLNKYWLIINGVLRQSPKRNFTGNAQDINSQNELEKYTCKIPSTSPWSQWVNGSHCSRDVFLHYSDVIMGVLASQITSLTSVYLTVY